jgi:DNA-directed RNA polymerase specialized sigma54-like protein
MTTLAMIPKLELRQSQGLVMAPQLQQAIKRLQMSNFELRHLSMRNWSAIRFSNGRAASSNRRRATESPEEKAAEASEDFGGRGGQPSGSSTGGQRGRS